MTETHRLPILVEVGPFYFQKAVTFLYLQLGTVGRGRSSRLDRLDAADGTRLRCLRSQRDGFVEELPLHQQVARVAADIQEISFDMGLLVFTWWRTLRYVLASTSSHRSSSVVLVLIRVLLKLCPTDEMKLPIPCLVVTMQRVERKSKALRTAPRVTPESLARSSSEAS